MNLSTNFSAMNSDPAARVGGVVFHARHKPHEPIVTVMIESHGLVVTQKASNLLPALAATDMTPDGLFRLYQALQWLEAVTLEEIETVIPDDFSDILDLNNYRSTTSGKIASAIVFFHNMKFRSILDCTAIYKPVLGKHIFEGDNA